MVRQKKITKEWHDCHSKKCAHHCNKKLKLGKPKKTISIREISLQGKVTIPLVQLSINYVIGCFEN